MKKNSVMTGASPSAEPIVRIRGLRKSFGNHVVLNGIDFDVLPSQVVVVIGPSYQREAPRLCRGGSRSLTFQEVVHRRDFQS